VSLFGPGFGECVVVHLGFGEWLVVDSCLNERRDQPVALEYLNAMGVDVATQVRLIVATHWHDDHIQGLARVHSEAHSARIAFSAAILKKEFFTLLEMSREIKTVSRDSSVSELRKVFDELNHRHKRGSRSQSAPDYWAQDGQLLHRSAAKLGACVTALSPSAQTITDAATRFGQLIPAVSSQIRRFPRCSPNDQSVALLVHAQHASVLLGADLETVADPARGWRAVISSAVRPGVISQAFKVAHHGSENGDLPEIWTTLLDENAPALLTPYSSGRKPLPSVADVARLNSRTSHVYCTRWPPTQKPKRRHRAVDRTIREMTRSHRAVPRQVGHIRLRLNLNCPSPPSIATFNGAGQL
jgi:beta-lactamase superfamily II metal-dependent hydrolase